VDFSSEHISPMQQAQKIFLNSLGCVRNLVDSEIMIGHLVAGGFSMTEDPSQADVIIVNTCGFIESAIEESIDAILELAEYKKTGKCRRMIVIGCLPQRYKGDFTSTIPEVDMFLGTGAYDQIFAAAGGKINGNRCLFPEPASHPLQQYKTRRVPSTSPLVYLKIAEGCNRRCTYCIIPKLRGGLRSRPVDDIICEAGELIHAGFKELVVIGQDTYSYGLDLRPNATLSALLERLAGLSEDVWIRLLYGSPDMTDDALIRTVAGFDNICSYFDIPVQHASPAILKKMGRPYSGEDLLRLFEKIRAAIPDAALRTTLLVGFPSETDKDFDMLVDFVKKVRFDHAGVFIYSDSEDLPSHQLAGHVPPKIARQRYDALMAIQRDISLDHNMGHVGKIYPVLIENQVEARLFSGRTWFQAPEVDGMTYIQSSNARIGEFSTIQITDAYDYDLKGKAV